MCLTRRSESTVFGIRQRRKSFTAQRFEVAGIPVPRWLACFAALSLPPRTCWRLNHTWVPSKRVKANREHLSTKQHRIFALRQQCAEFSHQAFRAARQAGDFSHFRKRMQPLLDKYAGLYRPGIVRLLGLKCHSASKKLANALGPACPGR